MKGERKNIGIKMDKINEFQATYRQQLRIKICMVHHVAKAYQEACLIRNHFFDRTRGVVFVTVYI